MEYDHVIAPLRELDSLLTSRAVDQWILQHMVPLSANPGQSGDGALFLCVFFRDLTPANGGGGIIPPANGGFLTMRLVQFTQPNGDIVYVNPHDVVAVEALNATKTRVHLADEHRSFTVEEAAADVADKIADDVG